MKNDTNNIRDDTKYMRKSTNNVREGIKNMIKILTM